MLGVGGTEKAVWAGDAAEGFVQGLMVDIGADTATVRVGGPSGPSRSIPYDQVFPAEPHSDKDVEDNCALMFLNEATLLHNLRLRYGRDKIYTYVANILIAVNPYARIPALYSAEVLRSYAGKSLGTLPPHVFAVADKAWRDMRRSGESQSIVVSGESGAGKTESQKLVLRFLCEVWGAAAGPIQTRILAANPILEAFGNAKTLRNNNSSRFGKFVEIHFGPKGEVVGGFVSHYLLEKSRIVGQGAGERNYHIFYQLCAGAPASLRQRLGLGPPEGFRYLRNGWTGLFVGKDSRAALQGVDLGRETELAEDPVVDDVRDWAALDAALEGMGMGAGERESVYGLIAGLLHLGNVSFEEEAEDTSGGCGVAEASARSLALAARLLGVEEDELRHGLTSRMMQPTRGGTKGTVIQVRLKKGEAAAARDALAKAVYARLFDRLVALINHAIPFSAQSSTYIGVLDIAGFEYFTVNGFEQFCINYCNEKLQHFFNDRILRQEQDLYEAEGLGVRKITFTDNEDCIQLIEEKPDGILDLVDEESKLPRPSPANFTAALHKRHRGHFRLDVPRKSRLKEHRELRDDEGFLLRHFAGAVCYQTALFLQKNNDALHLSLQLLLADSQDPLIRQLFKEQDSKASGGGGGKGGGRLSLVSVGSKFRSQLKELMGKLAKGGTHFVRCVKPNSDMVPGHFEGGPILGQLQCSGMASVLALMQQGFPSRTLFKDLYQMYQRSLPPALARLDPRLFCKCLFKALGLNDQDFKFGLTKVFFRPGKFAEFDEMMRADPEHLAALVAKVKKWLIRIRWKKAMWGALSVIKLKNKILWRRQQLVMVQSWMRGCLARRRFGTRIKALKKVSGLSSRLSQLSSLVQELSNSSQSSAALAKLESQMGSLKLAIKTGSMGEDDIERGYLSLVQGVEEGLKRAGAEAEGERVKKIQAEMEAAKAKEAEEARQTKLKEQAVEKEKVERASLERERRAAEERAEKEAALVQEQQRLFKEQEEQRRLRAEQEARDRNLAQQLAHGAGSATLIDDAPPPPQPSANANHIDLSKWKYADLRDVINTSTDISLLQSCKNEFHRRLAGYQKWREDTAAQARPAAQRAPDSVLRSASGTSSGTSASSSGTPASGLRPQRFFRVPFARPADRFRGAGGGEEAGRKTGLWWAHFDGPWIARQMEVHPDRAANLLVKGRHDGDMCEMSLDATGLARKRGAEILSSEFEAEWLRHGGQAYSLPSATNPPARPR